jgi:cold shock CspA family protein
MNHSLIGVIVNSVPRCVTLGLSLVVAAGMVAVSTTQANASGKRVLQESAARQIEAQNAVSPFQLMTGFVKFYNAAKGYGYVSSVVGDLFFSIASYIGNPSEIKAGEHVGYDISGSNAVNVRKI